MLSLRTVVKLIVMSKNRKRFLICALRFHGDILLTIPIVNCIKRVYPESAIDLLVYKGTGTIVENDSRIQNIFEAHQSSEISLFKRLFKEFNLIRRLRKNNYDFGLFLTTQWRVALLSRCIKVNKTAAVDDKKRRKSFWINSFSKIFPEAGNRHIIERNLSALETLGIKTVHGDSELRIDIPEESKAWVNGFIKDQSIKDNYCVLHPVSRRNVKQWKQESFAFLADHYSNLGMKVVMTSGPNSEEKEYLQSINNLSNSEIIDLGGKTTLFDLAALIEGAKFFVGLDSVASHIAAAVNTPGVTLFGPTRSENWRPWSEKIGVISRKGDEQLCSIHGHLKGKSKNCLCYITPEMVIQSLDKVVN